MHYVSRLFDSPAEIREQNDVERWKLQCNLSLDQVIKIKFLKYKTKEAQSWAKATALSNWSKSPVVWSQGKWTLPHYCSSLVALIQACSHPLSPYIWAIILCCVPGL